jgi:hypothetical protein
VVVPADRPLTELSLVLVLTIVCAVALARPTYAQETDRESSGQVEQDESLPREREALEAVGGPSSHDSVDGEEEPPDPCVPPQEFGKSVADWINRRVHRTVCSSAVWFDGFFGGGRTYDEYSHTGGRASVHLIWTEHDGFDPKLRFRVRVALPNLDERFDAFVGRESRSDYLTDAYDSSDPGSPLFGLDEEEDLLIGLGYSPVRGNRRRFRVSFGAKVDVPPEPYVKARYRYVHFFGERSMFRWRQTVFWELEDQFGITTNLDLERRFGHDYLLRWANTGTVSGISEGVDWWSNLTLYHSVDSRRAIAYTVWVTGETEAPVTTEEYGIRVVYRQRVHRDWLFVDIGPQISWPREGPLDLREPSFGAIIGFEMHFGERRW